LPANLDRRPTPEELLHRVQAEERRARRGRLKVFLGYASRVGKSFRMLDEGRRRKERGEDVVVASIQFPLTPDLEALMARLERASVRNSGVPVASAAATNAREGSPPEKTTHESPSEKNPRAATLCSSCPSESRYDRSVSPSSWTRVGTTPW